MLKLAFVIILLWNTKVHCLTADLVPARTNFDLEPGEWGTQSVVVCDPTLEGVTTSETITRYFENGNTNLDPESEINGTLDYFRTMSRGITQHKWVTTNGSLKCNEIINRFYNNVSLGLNEIGVRVIIRMGAFFFERKFNVTFLTELRPGIQSCTIASESGDGSGSGGSGDQPGSGGSGDQSRSGGSDHESGSGKPITTESERPPPGVIAESTAVGVTVPLAVVVVAALSIVVVLACLLVINRRRKAVKPAVLCRRDEETGGGVAQDEDERGGRQGVAGEEAVEEPEEPAGN